MFGVLNTSVLLWIAVSSVAFLLLQQVYRLRRNQSLPPGPSRWPIIGNALQIPSEHTWLTFSKWARAYGDIVYVEVVGQPLVILNSAQVAKDLLDKRSAIYSDRPHLIMAGDLVGYSRTFVLQPYGDEWRKQRRLVAQEFSQGIVPQYHSFQEREARKLIRRVLDDPATLAHQIKLRIGTIIIGVTYGYYIKSEDDPFLTLPSQAMDNFSRAAAPGAWLVDFIPQLRHVPMWMPGAGFLQTAAEWRQLVWDASWNPYLWSKKNHESGNVLTPNLCGNFFSETNGNPSQEDEERLVWAASAIMGGGLDTNMSTALTFFIAMILNPDIQARARAEIYSVVGTDRLPCIADRNSLPYVRSVITEVYRWNPAVPLGIAHSLSQADTYNGVYLPKGSLLIPNVWNMLHDPDVYENPMDFNPDRYKGLDSEMQQVTDLAFGFGRRACPGFYFASGTIFAIVATALATCDILPAVDEQGNDIMPEVAYTSGTIVFPKPFKCNLKCRSPQALAMLSQTSSSE